MSFLSVLLFPSLFFLYLRVCYVVLKCVLLRPRPSYCQLVRRCGSCLGLRLVMLVFCASKSHVSPAFVRVLLMLRPFQFLGLSFVTIVGEMSWWRDESSSGDGVGGGDDDGVSFLTLFSYPTHTPCSPEPPATHKPSDSLLVLEN